MKTLIPILLALVLASPLSGQSGSAAPTLGYVFPGGASRGQTVEIWLGGQMFQGIKGATITGEGVSLKMVKRYPKLRKLSGEQRKVFSWKMASRLSELGGRPVPPKIAETYEQMSEFELKRGMVVSHPLMDGIEEMDTGELAYLRYFMSTMNKYEFSLTPAVAETVIFELSVEEGAELGERELRLLTRAGLSNPLRFQISDVLELREVERRDKTSETIADAFELTEPVVWNGQVMAGDIDRFRLRMKEGETVVFEVLARRLIPYIADAVPGWFQPTLSISNEMGEQLAFVDDHVGSPDPILEFTAPSAGEYTIELRDSIYRGRFDFVYRLFASHERIEQNAIRHADVSYAMLEMPYVKEREPNGCMDQSTRILESSCVSGKINRPGDVDMLCFKGRAGEQMIAEVEARSLGAPTDSLLRLLDEDGQMIAFNDDYMPKQGHVHTGPGLQTHYADSYLSAEFPKDGYYYLVVEDAQGAGGAEYNYRLRLSQPEPAYEVRVAPSAVNLGATGYAPLHVWVNRKDGFDGPIRIVPAGDTEGYSVQGGFIPAGKNEGWITLSGHKPETPEHVQVKLLALASVGEREMSKPVVPTDNSMQAFLWRHLVPAQELRVSNLMKWRRIRGLEETMAPLALTSGTHTVLELDVLHRNREAGEIVYECQLLQGPEGWRIAETVVNEGTLSLTLVGDDQEEEIEQQGNMIVSMSVIPKATAKNKTPKPQWQGVLPAVPYVVEK